MHYAKIGKSDRLIRVFNFLQMYNNKWFSTMEIINFCKVCAVNSIISELRANGIEIETKRVGRIFYYKIKNKNISCTLAQI